jgi:ATP-dependent Clp protease adapter protein ClpS
MLRQLKAIFWPPVKVERVSEVVLAPGTSLLDLAEFIPEHFAYGVEILNDTETSMEFVVSVLREHAGMTRSKALLTAVDIHRKGGTIIKQDSLDQAQRITDFIVQSAREAKFPLACRAVSAQQRVYGLLPQVESDR